MPTENLPVSPTFLRHVAHLFFFFRASLSLSLSSLPSIEEPAGDPPDGDDGLGEGASSAGITTAATAAAATEAWCEGDCDSSTV